jgi:hypothetical protein
MSTEAKLTDASRDNSSNALNKNGWTERQHLQFMVGLWDGGDGHPVKTRELPEWNWVPNDDWRRLEGILSDHPGHDSSEMKAGERAFEEEHDARKFGRTASDSGR